MNNAFQVHDFEETLRSQRYSITQIVQRFNQFFDHIDQVVMDMVCSQAIQDSLVGKASRCSVNAMISSKSYKEGIYIAYLTNRNELYSSSIIIGYESALTSKLPHSAIFQKIDKTYAGLCWSLEDSNFFSPFCVSRDQQSLLPAAMCAIWSSTCPQGTRWCRPCPTSWPRWWMIRSCA